MNARSYKNKRTKMRSSINLRQISRYRSSQRNLGNPCYFFSPVIKNKFPFSASIFHTCLSLAGGSSLSFHEHFSYALLKKRDCEKIIFQLLCLFFQLKCLNYQHQTVRRSTEQSDGTGAWGSGSDMQAQTPAAVSTTNELQAWPIFKYPRKTK